MPEKRMLTYGFLISKTKKKEMRMQHLSDYDILFRIFS